MHCSAVQSVGGVASRRPGVRTRSGAVGDERSYGLSAARIPGRARRSRRLRNEPYRTVRRALGADQPAAAEAGYDSARTVTEISVSEGRRAQAMKRDPALE